MKTPENTPPTPRWSAIGAILGLSIATVTIPTYAEFTLVQDYESGLGSSIVSQTEETAPGSANTVSDPIPGGDPTNQVLAIQAGATNGNKITVVTPISTILDGGSGTVFLRYAIDTSASPLVGGLTISPLAAPAGWGDTNVILNPNNSGQLKYRNNNAYDTLEEVRNDLTWYKAWFVVDTANDTSSLYLEGGIYPEPTLVADTAAFRKDAVGEDLISLLFYFESGGTAVDDPNLNGTIYVDDIYVDTESANTEDPVPTAAPSGGFELVTDYESGPGDLSWTQSSYGTGDVTIVTDPWPSNSLFNNVLSIQPGLAKTSNIEVVTPIPNILEGSFGTVFLRYAYDTSSFAINGGLMISPLETPAGWGDTNVIINPNSSGQTKYRDGTGYGTTEEVRTDLVWYKAWMVVNTTADTSSLYLQGGAYTEPTLVAENYAFRKDATGEDLKSLLFYFSSGNAGEAEPNLNGTIYVDDIYVDTTTVNLSDPIPSQPIPSLGAYQASGSITLDGTKDASYRTSSQTGWFEGSVDSADDLSAELSATWDDYGVYLFIEVTDDVFNQDDVATYKDDTIQFAFDPDNSDSTSYDGVYDIAFVAQRLMDGTSSVIVSGFPAPPATADTSGLDGIVVLTATGYAAEVFVPWEALQIEPMGDWTMGFAMIINDDDGNDTSDPADGLGDREGIGGIWGGAGLNFNKTTNLFGDLTLLAPRDTQVQSTTSTITIDGTRDSAYGDGNVAERWTNAENHPEDNSATWHMVYDADNLYFFLEVVDDSVIAGESVNIWHDDGVELFLDGDNSKGGSFDGVNDVKLTFGLTDLLGGVEIITNGYPAPPAGTDFSAMETAAAVTSTGWNLEVKIPLSIIGLSPTPGTAFGIDFNLNDDDDGGDSDGSLTWSGATGFNNSTDKMGTAYLFDVSNATVEPTLDLITLDGNVDAAYNASAWNQIDRSYPRVSHNDLGAFWTAVYDDTNLYVIVDVYDDAVVNDSPNLYSDDGLEIYFDPSNDSSGGYDGVEDFKITVQSPVDGEVRIAYLAENQFPDPPEGTDFTGLEVEWIETTLGWRVEMQVPWATLRTTPVAGHDMGLDIFILDDDDGDSRDSTYRWSSLGNGNNQTELFGTVFLGGDPMFSTIIGAELINDTQYESSWFGMFYENPNDGDWIYHGGIKWIYTGSVAIGSSNSMWLYSLSLSSWVYTGSDLFPYIYVLGQGWIYYYESPEGVGYTYDLTAQSWMMIP